VVNIPRETSKSGRRVRLPKSLLVS